MDGGNRDKNEMIVHFKDKDKMCGEIIVLESKMEYTFKPVTRGHTCEHGAL